MKAHEVKRAGVSGKRNGWWLKSLLAVAAIGPASAGACEMGLGGFYKGWHGSYDYREVKANASYVNGPLTEWITAIYGGTPTTQYMRKCATWSRQSARFEVMGEHPADMGSYTEGGQTYTIYPTGIDGLGVVVRAYDKRLITYATQHAAVQAGVSREATMPPQPSSQKDEDTFRYQIRLIRTGTISDRGIKRTQQIDVGRARATRVNEDGGVEEYDYGGVFGLVPLPITLVEAKTCDVNTRRVTIPTVQLDAFSGEGSVSPVHRYQVELNCDADVGDLKYEWIPNTEVIDHSLGLAGLSDAGSSGTAKNVAIQYLDGDTPISFGQFHSFGYRTAPGRWPRTFGVRYYQTAGGDVLPGRADAVAQIMLIYP